MSKATYDYPVHHEVDLGDAQQTVTAPGETSKYSNINIVDAFGVVGSTPSAATISIGDGTTTALYGTVEIASGGTSGNALDVALNLTSEASSISGIDKLVFTNTSIPADAVTDFVVVIGYY